MSRGLVIAGTAAQVGKSVLARALIALLSGRGQRIAWLKPVEVGGLPLALSTLALPREAVTPFCFAPRLEPLAAARAAGQSIDLLHLRQVLDGLRAEHDLLLVEETCGLMAPLTDTHLTIDWLAELDLPLLLVAPSRLGAVNDCLLSLDLLRRRGISLAGVVLNRLDPRPNPEEAAFPYQIERFAGPVVAGILPFLEPQHLADTARLAHTLRVHVDVDALLHPRPQAPHWEI